MSAKDDFELVRAACVVAEPFMKIDPEEAFKNLFTPRPLRDVFEQGHRHCWAWNPEIPELQAKYYDLRHNISADFVGHYTKYLAIPILTPDDMGVK